MKRKTGLIAVLTCVMCICLCGAVACGKTEGKKDNTGVFESYVYTSGGDVTIGDVHFDGNFADRESVWKNANWKNMESIKANRGLSSTMVLADCTARGTVVVVQDGLYVAFETDDPIIYVGQKPSESLNPDYLINAFAKSGFTLYLTTKTNGSLIGNEAAYEIGFAADGTHTVRYNEHDSDYWMGNEFTTWGAPGVVSAAKVNGKLNTADTKGYSIEAYIPFSSLPSFQNISEYPDEVVAAFAMHRFTGVEEGKIQTWEMLDFANGQLKDYVHTWDTYNKDGYVTPVQGAVFGNYANNVYDSGFDLTKDIESADAQVTFTSTVRRESYLYVKEQKSDVQFAEVHFKVGAANTHGFANDPVPVTPDSTMYDNQPMMGVFFRGDITADETNRQHQYTFYSGVDVFQTEPVTDYDRRNFAFAFTSDCDNDHYFLNEDGGFKSCGEIPCNFTSGKDYTLTVLREGNVFYTYINGCFMSKRISANIANDAETFMGIFVLDTSVTVSDYEFLSGDAAQTKIDEYLAVRKGDTFTAVKSDGDTRLSVGDVDLSQDTGANKKTVISATLNQQIEVHVNGVPCNTNVVFAEYTMKFKEKPTMGYGRVTIAFTNADGDTVYFGMQAPNTAKIEMFKSWSAKNNEFNWNNPDAATTVAHHGSTKNILSYEQIDALYKGKGLTIAVYCDGNNYYFYADGKPIYCWANGGTNIRPMVGTSDGCLNVSTANITAISIGVDCQSVELSDYRFLYGEEAATAYREATGLLGETFVAKDFSGAWNTSVNLENDKGESPSVSFNASGVGNTGVATVNELKESSNEFYVEFTAKFNGKVDGGGYVIIALVNTEEKAVHFGFQINNALDVDDIRSWSSASGAMLNWSTTDQEPYNYAVHKDETDLTSITSALKGDGVRVSVYSDGTNCHFYLNGVAVKAYTGSTHIRNMNMGTSAISEIGIAVENANVTVSNYQFVLGAEAEQAHANADLTGCTELQA